MIRSFVQKRLEIVKPVGCKLLKWVGLVIIRSVETRERGKDDTRFGFRIFSMYMQSFTCELDSYFFNWKISKYYAVICFLLFAQWYVCNGLFLLGKFTEKWLNTCLIATGLVGCLVLHWIQSSFSANSYKKACGHAHNEKEIRISKRRRYKISIISITCTFGLKL